MKLNGKGALSLGLLAVLASASVNEAQAKASYRSPTKGSAPAPRAAAPAHAAAPAKPATPAHAPEAPHAATLATPATPAHAVAPAHAAPPVPGGSHTPVAAMGGAPALHPPAAPAAAGPSMTRTVVTSALTGLAAGAAGAALTHALLPGKSAPAAVPTTENATEKAATGTTGAPAAAAVATAVPAGAVPAAAKPEDPIVTGARAGDAAALRILRERATQGDAQAQLHMGQLLAAGTGVSPDHTQARKWLLVAAEKLPPGPDKAKAEEEAVRVGLQMTPEARTEADKQAHEFKSQPAPAAATPVPAAQ